MKNNSIDNDGGFRYEKTFRLNKFLSDKRVVFAVCIVFSVIIMIAVNAIWQAIAHIGDMIRGQFEVGMLFNFSIKYMPLYTFVVVVCVVLSCFLAYKMYSSFRNLNVGQKGYARLLNLEETEQRFTAVPEKDESFEGWGSMPVSRHDDKIFIDQVPTNTFVSAITRAGKGETLVIATIDIVSRAELKASMIIPDVKGELSKASVKHLIDRGYKVIIYDFIDMTKSHFYNPLQVIIDAYEKDGDLDFADELCTSLAAILYPNENSREPFWTTAPRSMFIAVVLAFVIDCVASGEKEKITMYSIYIFIATLGKIKDEKKLKSALDKFFLARPKDDPASLAYSSIEFTQGRTRGSVMALTQSALDIFRRPSIAKMTSKNTFNMSELGFGDKPVAIFFREPFYTRSYDALVTIFIDQAFYMNMHKGTVENNGKLQRRVRVVGDEIFNFPKINQMDNKMTVCLGAGWSFDLIGQSYEQVEDVYGKTTSKIILGNCGTQYFLSSPSEDSRKIFSEYLGKTTITNVQRSGSRLSLDKNLSESFEERALMTPQELTNLEEGEIVVFPTMKRRDLKGKSVVPMPLLTTGETNLTYRNKYLPEFDPDGDIPYDRFEIPVGGLKSVDLKRLIYLPPDINVKAKGVLIDHKKTTDVYNTAQISYLSSLIPIDLENLTVGELYESVEELHAGGEIQDREYKAIVTFMSGGD